MPFIFISKVNQASFEEVHGLYKFNKGFIFNLSHA